MGCRRVAALHLAPLLARLFLAACFIPFGWNKVMERTTVDGPTAARIRAMLDDPWATDAAAPEDATSEDPESKDPDGGSDRTDASTPATADDETPAPAEAEAPLEVRRVMLLAELLHDRGLPLPVVLAWAAAIVELVGAGLLAIGLLSRIWAFGLAVAMGFAFALTSLDAVTTMGPFGLELAAATRAAAQLALGGLALVVLVAGPGGVSMDQLIFGGGRGRDVFDDDPDED